MNKLKILVMGAGAIGTYIGGSLISSGNIVTFVEQPRSVSTLRKKGITLGQSVGDAKSKTIQSSTIHLSPTSFSLQSSLKEALLHTSFDLSIYALKSFDTAAFIKQMKPLANKFPPILCLSNGVENETMLAGVLGEDKVIAGTVTSSVSKIGVGDIVLEKKRGIGLDGKSAFSQQIMDVFIRAGLSVQLYANAESMKWSKLLTNILANATSAILGMTPFEILSNPDLFEVEMGMLREALAVMKVIRLNVTNLPETPVRLLSFAANLPYVISRPLMKKTAGSGRGGKMPSFYIDLHSGRGKSEVAWLNGAVAKFGKSFDIATPINKKLTEILIEMTDGHVPLSNFLRQPEKLLFEIKQ